MQIRKKIIQIIKTKQIIRVIINNKNIILRKKNFNYKNKIAYQIKNKVKDRHKIKI